MLLKQNFPRHVLRVCTSVSPPSELRVDCVRVSTAPVKAAIDDHIQRLFDALLTSLRRAIAADVATIETFLTTAMTTLAQRPQTIEEIGPAKTSHAEFTKTKSQVPTHTHGPSHRYPHTHRPNNRYPHTHGPSHRYPHTHTDQITGTPTRTDQITGTHTHTDQITGTHTHTHGPIHRYPHTHGPNHKYPHHLPLLPHPYLTSCRCTWRVACSRRTPFTSSTLSVHHYFGLPLFLVPCTAPHALCPVPHAPRPAPRAPFPPPPAFRE